MGKFFKFLFNLILIAAIIGAGFWVRGKYAPNKSLVSLFQKEEIAKTVTPIELAGPRTIAYQWKYNNTAYELSLTLYDSLYQFYKGQPKTYQYSGDLPANWETDFYAMFLKKNPADQSIQELARKLSDLAAQKKLSADQSVELVLAFVQNLDYDDAKASLILSGSQEGLTSYPYETLYEKKGVCNDKSFLASAVLTEMGYGTALFVYDTEKHMALGVKCSQEYSSYGSGYCYAETTSPGFRIGIIPDVDPQKGKAVALQQLGYFENSELQKFSTAKLGEAKIFPESGGKTYAGIAQSIQTAKEIDSLKNEIATLGKVLAVSKNQITEDGKNIDVLAKKMEKLKKDGNVNDYNDTVPKYNKMVKDYQKEVSDYNSQVAAYNKKIDRYNSLIKNF